MDYLKHYMLLMKKAKDRGQPEGYFERHHIIPDFMFKNRTRGGRAGHMEGNFKDPSNIVKLTAREHFISHLLLAKGLKKTRYANQAGSALIFFWNIGKNKHPRSREGIKCTSRTFAKAREIGRQSISNARKGKMPCVDAKTGEKIGSIETSHPKILSGEWVHHSKGKPGKKGANHSGEKNANYKKVTDEMRMAILERVKDECIDEGYLIGYKVYPLILSMYPHFKKVSSTFIRNKFGSMQGLVDEINRTFGVEIKYYHYHRGSEQRQKFSDKARDRKWYTDGKDFKLFKKGQQPDGWVLRSKND